MKNSLRKRYREVDLKGKAVLQPILDELFDLRASGRTYIALKELLGFEQ